MIENAYLELKYAFTEPIRLIYKQPQQWTVDVI